MTRTQANKNKPVKSSDNIGRDENKLTKNEEEGTFINLLKIKKANLDIIRHVESTSYRRVLYTFLEYSPMPLSSLFDPLLSAPR